MTENKADPRFYIDHGTIHDRKTGKHVVTDGVWPFEDDLPRTLKFLNEIVYESDGMRAEIERLRAALAAPQPAAPDRIVAHEDCLNCRCEDDRRCRGTEPKAVASATKPAAPLGGRETYPPKLWQPFPDPPDESEITA